MKITASDQSKYIEVGSSNFLYSFFSTIYCKVLPDTAALPAIKFLKEGIISSAECEPCAKSFEYIRTKLSTFPPSEVVWNKDDLKQQPPWGNHISSHITSLGNYFVTADGQDLIDALVALLRYASAHTLEVHIH